MTIDWHGVFPAVTTQFLGDGSIDLEATCRNVDRQITEGVHGIVALGTVGENYSLDDGEKRRVLKALVETVDSRVPLLTGVAETTTAAAESFSREAEAIGVDGLMACMLMVVRLQRRIQRLCFATGNQKAL